MISFFSLLVLLQLGALVHAQQGFLSLACGTTPDFIYKDTIGISYISDAQFVETGTTQKIADYVIPPHPAYSNLRNFPDGARNCYNLKPVNNGNKYMVRTSFLYGNYDGLNRPPVFDVHVGVNFWKMINITSPTVAFWYEITMVAMSNSISLCFVNVGMGIPFVNIIDVRPINNVMYSFIVDTTHALSFYNRKNFGGNGIRYPDDVYDRPWNAIDDPSWTHISSSSSVNVSATITDPPEAVMRTAVYPTNDSTLAFRFQMDTGLSMEPSIFIMHFAELEELSKNKSRKFSINVNGYHWYGPFSPKYLTAEPIYPATPTATSWWLFSLEQSSDSTLPPAINGIELYFVKHFMLLETNSGDVDAINNVKEVYNIKRNWNGDPCLPISYAWEGLNCSNTNVSSPPQIISLNLSFSGLHGDISSSFANLMFLQILDLSSNNLTGQIPSILAELPSLKFLYLDGNQLNGPIPAALLDKANNGSLFLSARVGDDLDECKQQDKCKRHKKTALLIAVISSLIAAVVIISTLMGIRKLITRRGVIKTSDEMCNPQSSNTDPEPRDISQRQLELNQTEEIMEPVEASGSSYLTASDGWQFSYDQIVRITNRFETPIGEGGFGEVFVGFLSNGTRVAVKKLKTSRQDNVSLQFQNEVQLLMKVQHDNLVPFNGYCDDGVHKALVCKFMPGGDLKKYLSGTSDNRARLNWKKRIEIALGSARGLEYLHNQLHIVHRDVKPENILLNENLEAKIADFGLGRILSDENVTRIVTERVAGTIGYLDPEYYSNQVLSYKSDVYSFGVVLLQLITGKPPVISISPTEGIHITHWLDSRLDQTDIVDPSFAGNYHMMSVRKAIKLGKECTRSKSAERPAMKNVVLELETCLNIENNRNIQASR